VYERVQEPVHSCLITGRDAATLLVQEPGQSKPRVIEVPPYHVLLFHGRLVHAGMGYKETRLRLHCYIGGPKLLAALKKDELQAIKPSDADALLNTTDADADLSTSLEWTSGDRTKQARTMQQSKPGATAIPYHRS
jgi:hypothetical protein